MDSWMLWLDGALEVERAVGAAPVLAATYISLRSVPVTPESVDGRRGTGMRERVSVGVQSVKYIWPGFYRGAKRRALLGKYLAPR